ncbi:MAG: hypothetical protein ABW138_19815, partial [Candidatus Thiodiazotropha sp. 4PDIVS1]
VSDGASLIRHPPSGYHLTKCRMALRLSDLRFWFASPDSRNDPVSAGETTLLDSNDGSIIDRVNDYCQAVTNHIGLQPSSIGSRDND